MTLSSCTGRTWRPNKGKLGNEQPFAVSEHCYAIEHCAAANMAMLSSTPAPRNYNARSEEPFVAAFGPVTMADQKADQGKEDPGGEWGGYVMGAPGTPP
jgi:hypothetical protein